MTVRGSYLHLSIRPVTASYPKKTAQQARYFRGNTPAAQWPKLENVGIPLLGEVYGCRRLENLNLTTGLNYPGIDLGDKSARVAIQVTSTPGSDKIKATLTKFVEYKLYRDCDRLIVYILTEDPTLLLTPT